MKTARILGYTLVVWLVGQMTISAQEETGIESGIMSSQMAPLPHARGKSFSTLDDYLAHLKELGAMDIPYYELQPDSRYRFITGRGGNRVPPVYFTREELMQKFGFSE